MTKSKRPGPAKPSESPEGNEEISIQSLCDLAIELVKRKDGDRITDALKQKEIDFHKIIKKSLQQKKDDILYEALDRAKYVDEKPYRFLKSCIDEASEILVVRRDEGKSLEINVFVIPMFVHTLGGLRMDECFQDQHAFDLLANSFQKHGLESPDAKVVLVSHAYHLEEIDRITYSDLAEMLRDAFGSMTEKKARATPAIERSVSGWPDYAFEQGDDAVELRFLLGFAMKPLDDPFYLVPEEEAAADMYFAAREERFQKWTAEVQPLVAACLVSGDRTARTDFLYQDLFHGGKERGIAEYFMLQMMSELNHELTEKGIRPADASAVVGPFDTGGEVVLKVVLTTKKNGTLIASCEKPLCEDQDFPADMEDTCDALMTLGMKSLFLAAGFDGNGHPIDMREYESR